MFSITALTGFGSIPAFVSGHPLLGLALFATSVAAGIVEAYRSQRSLARAHEKYLVA